MHDLVFTKNNELFTNTLAVAQGCGVDHDSVYRMCRKYQNDLSDLSKVGFEIVPFEMESGQTMSIFELTEPQATFLITLMRNTEPVVSFKKDLTKAFYSKRFAIPQTFAQALLLASQQAEQIEQQNALLLEQKSKVEFHDAVIGSKTTTDLGTVAKLLNYKGYGRNNLFDLLRSKGVLMLSNRPFQRYVDSGHFRVVESKYMVNAEERISFKTVVFQKGIAMIKKILDDVTKQV